MHTFPSASASTADSTAMHPKMFAPRPVRPLKRRLFEDSHEAQEEAPYLKQICLPFLPCVDFRDCNRSDSFLMSSDRARRLSRPPSRSEDESLPRILSAPTVARHKATPSPSIVSPSRSPNTTIPPRYIPTPAASFTDDSRPSSRVKSSTDREDLERNGILVQPHRRHLLHSVETYAYDIISTTRKSPELSADDIDTIVDQLHANSNEDENTIKEGYIATQLFPAAGLYAGTLKVGNDIPFDSTGLPHLPLAPPLPASKPDRHYCFDNLVFSNEEDAKMRIGMIKKYAKPSLTGCWPFFTVEFKSEAKGGTLWTAENQNAGSGALCINAMEKLLALSCSQRNETDSIAFSCTVNALEACLWVHYCSQTKFISCALDRYHMAKGKDVTRFRNSVDGIIKFGIRTRLPLIKDALSKIALPDLESMDKSRRSRKHPETEGRSSEHQKKVTTETNSPIAQPFSFQPDIQEHEHESSSQIDVRKVRFQGQNGWLFQIDEDTIFSPNAEWYPALRSGRRAQVNRIHNVWFWDEEWMGNNG